MKQASRFFLKPGSFVNQLQWSPHHTLILAVFFLSALVETQFGSQRPLYGHLAGMLSHQYGIGLGLSIWIMTFLKLAALQIGAWVLTECIYFLGTLFGKSASRRVLFRRLAVVFSLLLLAQTTLGLADRWDWAWIFCVTLWAWGCLLGYLTLREQFALSFSEATAIGVFALFLAVGSWSYASLSLQRIAYQRPVPSHAAAQLAKRPAPSVRYRR